MDKRTKTMTREAVRKPNRRPTVLVIEDEPQMCRLLKINLEGAGYTVFEAANGRFGLVEAASRRPDVVLLDLGLPDMDGLQVLKQFREWSNVPIVVLTVRDGEDDKVAALESGADDYMTKPFGTRELLARIKVALRHAEPTPGSSVFRSAWLEVDLPSHVVKVNGNIVRLTGIEFTLLRLLIRHAGKVLTHDQIMKEVWSPEHVGSIHYLHIYMSHLRQKIELDPAEPGLLITEPRVGYRLVQR